MVQPLVLLLSQLTGLVLMNEQRALSATD